MASKKDKKGWWRIWLLLWMDVTVIVVFLLFVAYMAKHG